MPLNWNLITAEVLASLELDNLIESFPTKECRYYGSSLTAFVKKDESKWSQQQLEALRFVEAAMSMMLRSDHPSEPYGPMFVMGETRSAIPADFPRDSLLDLLGWATALLDPELRARFLDVIWIQAKSFPAAQGAIRAYIDTAKRLEHPEEWTPCVERLERALRLAASLGKGGVDLRNSVLAEIEAAAARHRGEDPLYLTHRLIGLLLEFQHGDAGQLAQMANTGAERAETGGDFWRARDYHQRAAECFAATGDNEAQAAALRRSAEALAKEADAAVGEPGRGFIAASSILSQAVNAMRQAPGGRQRADELHERMLQLQGKTMEEMKSVSTSFDSSELANRATAAVRDKTFRDAVIALCAISHPLSPEQLGKQVEEQARVAVLSNLLHRDIVNSRGRVVAKAPPLTPGVTDPADPGMRVRMFQNARHRRNLTVQAILNPARGEIVATHNPSREDVLDLIRHSPWAPPGHIESISRALVAGFHGDMLVASHLVPPQLEAMVRHVAEIFGGSTSMFDPQGLQPEKSLNALLEMDEARKAFGDAGLFELQDLLVDQLGTNLRNEVAHGLLEDGSLFGTDALYAWWLLLRYCVLTSPSAQPQAA